MTRQGMTRQGMTRQGWTRIAQLAAVAGGLAWLGKIVTIVVYGGLGGPLEGPLFGLGLLLILIGATGIAMALPLRSRALLAVAVLAVLVVAWNVIFGLELLAVPLLGGLLQVAAAGEEGILLVAVIALVAGAVSLLRSTRRLRAVTPRAA